MKLARSRACAIPFDSVDVCDGGALGQHRHLDPPFELRITSLLRTGVPEVTYRHASLIDSFLAYEMVAYVVRPGQRYADPL